MTSASVTLTVTGIVEVLGVVADDVLGAVAASPGLKPTCLTPVAAISLPGTTAAPPTRRALSPCEAGAAAAGVSASAHARGMSRRGAQDMPLASGRAHDRSTAQAEF